MKIAKNRSGNYAVRFKTASGYTTKSLGTKSLSEAKLLVKEAKIEEIESAAKIGALQREAIASIVSGGDVKMQDAIAEWKDYKANLAQSENTIFSQEAILQAFASRQKINSINQINESTISAYINEPGDVKLGAREQRLSAIKSLLQFSVAKCYILTDPSKLVAVDKSKLTHKKKEKKKRKPISEFEFHHIMKHAEHFNKQATALAWWTGMRLSDIARLEWDSIDFENRTLIVHTKKTDTRICLPLDHKLLGGGELVKLLADIEVSNKTYVFPQQCELDKDVSRRATLSTYYGRMLARLGIEGKSFHSLRHSFVSRCRQEGESLEEVALWVGHSSAKTTEIYDHQGPKA
jgi:integrase